MSRSVLGLSLLSVAAAASFGALGCQGNNQCLTDKQYFAQKVWGDVMSKTCIKCHAPEGVAADRNAKLLLLTSAYPAFLDSNFDTVTEVAKIQYDGASELLLKPLGKLNHGGGAVIQEGSEEYKTLAGLVEHFAHPVTCTASAPASESASSKVTLLDPPATLRKASLSLAGRLPTADEVKLVTEGGEAALGTALDALMKEEVFYTRIKEIYNDVLLTNQYHGNGLDLLADDDYASKYWWNPNKVADDKLTQEQRDQRWYSTIGVGSEPLELIAYVIRGDKPFSEILMADYTVVNPYSARVYGLDPMALGFTATGDYASAYYFLPAHVILKRKDGDVPFAHAGVLTQPVYLNRYNTTTTNLNRHRARFLLKNFLATDILKVAERPIDPSSVTSLTPTRDDPYCKVCHKVIDPIAGTFQKFDGSGRFFPKDASWPAAMPQPGFGQSSIDDVRQYPQALQWLAKQVTQDPRFVTGTIYTAYRGLTGREPLPYPAQDSADFVAQLAAWQDQENTFAAIGDVFVKSNMNFKTVVKGILLSAAYRAQSGVSDKPAELEGFGTGRFLSPELLSRKIFAVTGVHWSWGDGREQLLTDYNLLYGGIDSVNVTERLSDPNGIMANVSWRMSNEMGCWATAWDFTKPQAQRTLFPYVEASNRPEDDSGYEVPRATLNVKRNIQYLHQLILGETLPLEHPEIERTYQLFLKTFRELQAAGGIDIPWECRGRWDRTTGKELPAKSMIEQDRYYTIRSWQAVVTYLLLDYKFLYE